MPENFEKAARSAQRPAAEKVRENNTLAGFLAGAVGDRIKRSADIVGIQSRILMTRFGLAIPKTQVAFSKLGARGFVVDDAIERADQKLKKSAFDAPVPRKVFMQKELLYRGNEAVFYKIGLDTTHARKAYFEAVRKAWHFNVNELTAKTESEAFGTGLTDLMERGKEILEKLPASAAAYRTRVETVLNQGIRDLNETRTAYSFQGTDAIDRLMVAFDYLKRVDKILVRTGLGLIETNKFAPKKLEKGDRIICKEVIAEFREYAQHFRKGKGVTVRDEIITLGTTAAALINSGRELLIAEKNLNEMRDARAGLREGRERIIDDRFRIERLRKGEIVLTDVVTDDEEGDEGVEEEEGSPEPEVPEQEERPS